MYELAPMLLDLGVFAKSLSTGGGNENLITFVNSITTTPQITVWYVRRSMTGIFYLSADTADMYVTAL